MADEDGFEYDLGHSTSNIFYYHPIINPQQLRVLRWRPIPVLNETDLDPAQQTTVCSSCCGLIAARSITTGVYYVGNPYQPDIPGYIPLRYAYLTNPTPNNSNVTHAVLAVVPPSLFLLICAIQEADNAFRFDAFASSNFRWRLGVEVTFEENLGRIVPGSGVSVGRTAYWLLGEPGHVPTSLLSFSIEETVAVMDLPSRFRLGYQARMQLGRALGKLGLVVVNETDSKVELFILQDDNPDDPLQREERFYLEVDDAAEDVAMWREEDLTMVCREMPRPIRFDSFKVELLFWVEGRVVLLEENSNRADHAHEYRLTVLPDQDPRTVLPDEEVPELITSNGVPHVHSGLLAPDFFD